VSTRTVSAVLFLLAACAMAGDRTGVPPRAAADYPARQTVGGVTIAAAVLSPEKARQLFDADLDRAGYLVVEIALYPEPGKQIDVSPGDFRLRMGPDPATVRPITPQTLATVLRKADPTGKTHEPKIQSPVTVYNTETIGYESGPYGRKGVYTASEVGVGIGHDPNAPHPPPTAKSRDRATLQYQLEEMALPETKTTRAVAGLVYFPKPSQKRSAACEVLYFGLEGQGSLKLPVPAR